MDNKELSEALQNRTPVQLSPLQATKIAAHIRSAINDHCGRSFDRAFRFHLGASVIGDKCARKIWLGYRWTYVPVFMDDSTGEDVSGRMLRLFNRGHREEPMLISYLRGIGFEVWEYQNAETEEQFRISDHEGHFGGSLDGLAFHPQYIDDVLLLEMKTYNDKRFKKLVDAQNAGTFSKGVRETDPKYASQMDVYGFKLQCRYALFVAINKNDDDILIQIYECDWQNGQDKINLAGQLIQATTPPPKISKNPTTFFDCKFCDALNVCHKGEPVAMNCRSCKFARPARNKEWFCTHYNQTIPPEFIAKGCPEHRSIVTG